MHTKQHGFSLIEILISFLLIGVASLALVKLQTYVEQRSDFAVKSTEALSIAEQKMEWFRTRGASAAISTIAVPNFSSISSGSDSMTHAPYRLEWEVSVPYLPLSSSLRSIVVTTSWSDRLGETQSVKIETMLSGHSEFNM